MKNTSVQSSRLPHQRLADGKNSQCFAELAEVSGCSNTLVKVEHGFITSFL
jgi:hypothetical protein